jgi:hypothetical protein
VNDLGTVLLVLVLGDPLGGEGLEGALDGTTSPYGVVSIGRGNDLNISGFWAKFGDFHLESIWDTLVKSGTTGKDDVSVKVGSNIKIAVSDGFRSELVHAEGFVTFLDEAWVEESFWGHESWGVNTDVLTIWELVGLGEFGAGTGFSFVSLKVEGNESGLFLNGSDNLSPGAFTTLLLDTVGGEEGDEVVGDGSSGDEVLVNGVRNGETFIDWDSVGNTISGIDDATGSSTVGVEGKDGLDGNVHTGNLESLEHELGHLLSVGFWVHWGLSKENVVLGGIDSELVGEAVLPDLLHLGPVGNDTGVDWVGKVEDTSHLVGLITDVLGFGLNTEHLLVVSWDTDDGWEFAGWLVLASETGLDNTGSVINNNVLIVRLQIDADPPCTTGHDHIAFDYHA